jgi:hypothetical protein
MYSTAFSKISNEFRVDTSLVGLITKAWNFTQLKIYVYLFHFDFAAFKQSSLLEQEIIFLESYNLSRWQSIPT